MTKIKNFRITLRPKEIGRLLKSQAQLQMTPALEASIEHAVNDSKRLLQPSAVYTTLMRSTAEKATSLPLTGQETAASLIGATIGPALQEELSAAEGQDAMQAALLRAVRDEALYQAIHFIMRLIDDQAKEEECETSAVRDVTDGALLKSLGSLIGMQRIGIDLENDNPQLPPFSRLVWTVWSPKVRAKAAAKSAARPEKAAV